MIFLQVLFIRSMSTFTNALSDWKQSWTGNVKLDEIFLMHLSGKSDHHPGKSSESPRWSRLSAGALQFQSFSELIRTNIEKSLIRHKGRTGSLYSVCAVSFCSHVQYLLVVAYDAFMILFHFFMSFHCLRSFCSVKRETCNFFTVKLLPLSTAMTCHVIVIHCYFIVSLLAQIGSLSQIVRVVILLFCLFQFSFHSFQTNLSWQPPQQCTIYVNSFSHG